MDYIYASFNNRECYIAYIFKLFHHVVGNLNLSLKSGLRGGNRRWD